MPDPWTPPQPAPIPPYPPYPPTKLPWWQDGGQVMMILSMILGFGGTWLSMYYQSTITRHEVEQVQNRQAENAAVIKDVQKDASAVRSAIIGDK